MQDPSVHIRYLISSDQDPLWGLIVQTVGKQTVDKYTKYPPERHPTRYLFDTRNGRVLNEYQLVYIVQGSGTFQSASCKETRIQAGCAFLLFPGEWHNYYPDPETGWIEYWIGFQGENIDRRVQTGFFSRQEPVFFIGLLDDIPELYNQGITVAREQNPGYQQMLAGIVNHLLGIVYSMHKNIGFEHKKVTEQINRAKIFFAENFCEKISVVDVAKQFNVSYSWFRKAFKAYTGFAPAAYIQELRIGYAKELLTNSTMSIKEVAYTCGYETSEYFFTAFKLKTGFTPKAYREFTQGRDW